MQNPQAPQTAEVAAAPAHVPIKQEQSPPESRRGSRLSIDVPSRKTYQEQLKDGGDIIDLSTPVEETFIKPDPDANVQTSNNDNDVFMEGQAETDAARSSTVSGSFPVAQCTETAQVEAQILSSPRASTVSGRLAAAGKLRQSSISASQVESQTDTATAPSTDNAVSEVTGTARQGKMAAGNSTAIAQTPVSEEALLYVQKTPIYNADNSGVIMDIGKPTSPEVVALGSEADIMAANFTKVTDSVGIEAEIIISIEAADRASSAGGTKRQCSPSDDSINPDEAIDRARSGNPTRASVRDVAQNRSESMSPTPQPDSFMVANTRAASISSEAEPVKTIDVDMETGYDVGKESADEDEDFGSPSRQLMRDSTEDDGFEMIEKQVQASEITAWEITDSAIASVAAGKPIIKTFEEARAAALAKKHPANKPTERAEFVKIVDKPTGGFEEAMRAASSPASKPVKSPKGAVTPFPVVEAQVEVPNTPISVKKSSTAKQSDVRTGDQDFIDLDTIIPQTPVKQTTPVGLTKNASVTTPASTKATPNTVDRQLSAAGKGMAGLDLNNSPRRSLFGNRTPRSTASVGSVGSPITGNAGSGPSGAKKSTPIKRERVDDGENDVVETDGTPSKKLKYLSLGSQDAPISFDTDDDE